MIKLSETSFRENLSIKKSEILLLQKLSDSSETRFPKLLIVKLLF